jgi:flagellar biogenesis protein FliO
MTRSSIEATAKIFVVALIIVFIWTVTKVMEQIGWL